MSDFLSAAAPSSSAPSPADNGDDVINIIHCTTLVLLPLLLINMSPSAHAIQIATTTTKQSEQVTVHNQVHAIITGGGDW